MSSVTISAAQEAENARINAENERLRRQATRRRLIGLGFSYLALILVTILMLFPLIIVVLVSFTPNEITQTWPPKLIPSAFTSTTTPICSAVCRSAASCSTPSCSLAP